MAQVPGALHMLPSRQVYPVVHDLVVGVLLHVPEPVHR